MKKCSKCGLEKPKSEFYARPERTNGVRSSCKACDVLKAMAFQASHPDKQKAALAKYYRDQKERDKAKSPEWHAARLAAHKAKAAKWRKEHPGANAKSVAAWYRAHPDKTAVYRATKLRAAPAWANQFFIQEAYALARLRTEQKTGGHDKWHVDHIVPLRSKLVCGLHVENNLEVIPAYRNRSKGNRYWPDMPEVEYGR